ncbi:hypothetical protein ARMGADRAFT_1018131 [Armillaria gallica]|uniref:Uncharacterized protein n=1 Tax=Armillaria gallica TaxID=47427 RepID=A0A2H3CPU3_ARMGA|nr:hypothetical protein ARMGADRAFT_1018131 [Armillaria gallica]
MALRALRVVCVLRVAAIFTFSSRTAIYSKKSPRLPFSPPYLGPVYSSRTSGFPS